MFKMLSILIYLNEGWDPTSPGHLGKAELFFLSLQDQTEQFPQKKNVGTGNQLERGLAKSRSHKKHSEGGTL